MKSLERAYPWLLLAPVVLPVVIWDGLIYPYLVPKTLLFYALSLLVLAVFGLLVAMGNAFYWGRLRHWTAGIPLALLALAYVASVAGIDFYRSFWSIFVRGDGLLMLTCATADFYLIFLYANKVFFERFLRAVAVVATSVAVYGIGEWLFAGGRVGSLLGNAAFFAGYLGITFFVTLMTARSLAPMWRQAAYAGAALQLIAIVLSATRGTILALGVATLAAIIYLAVKGQGHIRSKSIAVLLVLVLLGGLSFAFREQLAAVPFSPVARIASISTKEGDVASRLFVWKHMVTEIGHAPVLGVGAEHIDVLFNRFYDPTQIQEEWFDRSHNAFLDYAAQYGVGGALLYLALISSFLVVARRLRARGEGRLAGLAVLLAVTYAVQNFFVFDTVSSFWLFLAILAALLGVSGRETPAASLQLSKGAVPIAWGLGAVLVLLIVPVSVRPAMAAYDLAHAYKFTIVDVDTEISYLSDGMALGTYGDVEYGYTVYDMYVNRQFSRLSGEEKGAAYAAALAVLTKNFNAYPYDARTALYLAHVLSLAPTGVVIDKGLLAESLARTIKESPKRAQSWYVLVNLSISEANTHVPGSPERVASYAAAKDILSRYVALVPTLSEPHFVLAEIAHATGDAQTAATEAALGKEYYTSDLPTARRAATYFEGVNNWPDARFFLSDALALDPSADNLRYDLAKVTYLSGDLAGAETIVAGLRKTNPNILATDPNFLAAITAYERSR